MATTNFKLQMKNTFSITIFLLTLVLILNSCGTPTTVIKRGQIEEIDKERIIMQGIALDTYYKRLERINNSSHPTSPERWVNIKETQKEIRYKEENGINLMPERVKNN